VNTEKLNLADIEIVDRLREVDDALAELIAASFRQIGKQRAKLSRFRG
jgi:hypothetical protein